MKKEIFTENGFTFVVEKSGTVTASGKVGENPASRSGMGKIIPNGYQSEVHDKGHLVAALQGGTVNPYNISAQARGLNRGAYKTVENGEIRAANRGYEVESSKTAFVSNPGEKPDNYMISDTITTPEGKTQSIFESFQNESAEIQETWSSESAKTFSEMADAYSNPNSRPEGMAEKKYSEFMESTESALPSVRDDFEIDNLSEISVASSEGPNKGIISDGGAGEGVDGTGNGVQTGCDAGCGM